jgi:hypothetical protein
VKGNGASKACVRLFLLPPFGMAETNLGTFLTRGSQPSRTQCATCSVVYLVVSESKTSQTATIVATMVPM